MAKKTKDPNLSIEERLEQALIPNWDEPYKLPENWCWINLKSVLGHQSGNSKLIKGKLSSEKKDGLYDAYSASGQDVYTESYEHEGTAIIVSSVGARCGKAFLASGKWSAIANTHIIYSNDKLLDIRYLHYVLNDESWWVKSGSAQPFVVVNESLLRPFALPPLQEQQRIISRIESLFTKLDAAKEKAQDIVDGFETRKATILHKAFSGELTAKWRDACNVTIESWQKVDLIDVLIDKPRNGFSPKPVDYVTPYKSMTLSATTSGVFLPEHFKYVDETIPMDSYLWLKPGDILIQRANSLEKVGTSAIYTGKEHDFIYPDLMMKLQVKGDTSTQYISYHLKTETVLRYLRSNATGTAGNMPKINQKTVSSIPINLPTLKEQEEIVRLLDMLINKEQIVKEAAEAVIERIDTMKKAILARAFRGELGTNDPSEESAFELLKRVLESK